MVCGLVAWSWGHGAAADSTVHVTVAVHEVPAGHRLVADDLREVPLSSQAAQLGSQQPVDQAAVVGKKLAVPVRPGQQVTSGMVVSTDLAESLSPGQSVVGVRARDVQTLQLVAPGHRVTAWGRTSSGETVQASGVLVWAPPATGQRSSGGTGMGRSSSVDDDQDLVLLSVADRDAVRLASIDGAASLVVGGDS